MMAFKLLKLKLRFDLKDIFHYYSNPQIDYKTFRKMSQIKCEWIDIDEERRKKLEYFYEFLINPSKIKNFIEHLKTSGTKKIQDETVYKTPSNKRKRIETTTDYDDETADESSSDECDGRKNKYIYDIRNVKIEGLFCL